LDEPGPIAFAHRGYDPSGAENSMRAFQQAIDLGYRYLETDVRVSADGVAFTFHDARLDRLTDRVGAVARLEARTVAGARIAGTEPIPRLDDVLATWPDIRFNLDLKHERSIAATIAAIRHAGAIDRVCIAAFSDGRVEAARQVLGAGVCTSLGPRAAIRLRLASRVGRLPQSPVGSCVQVPYRLGRVLFTDQRLVDTAHEVGLPLHVWTVNDPIDMQRALDLGVDGVMTDRADLLRDILVRRGLWASDV
jgi:glycerophosphoryl diester phosphodiesterase